MKILFLDIDGVLNSERTAVACNGFPHGFTPDQKEKFDWIAIKLIRQVCYETNAAIILSSSWRIIHDYKDVAYELDLPIIGATPSIPGADRIRGDEIAAWLDHHPGVTSYAIVDDDSDMKEDQLTFFVKTDGRAGLSLENYTQLINILGPVVNDEHIESSDYFSV